MVTNKTLPKKVINTESFSSQASQNDGDTQISDDEDGEDDEDPLPEE
jgi:hypothetical protein